LTNVQEDHYSELKRCVLIPAKPAPDISRGCAGKRIRHSLFATLPHYIVVRLSDE
jgi:ketosteroid isomerase-like protein